MYAPAVECGINKRTKNFFNHRLPKHYTVMKTNPGRSSRPLALMEITNPYWNVALVQHPSMMKLYVAICSFKKLGSYFKYFKK
jgi:hypothetical protein